jgi:hypothetical protein
MQMVRSAANPDVAIRRERAVVTIGVAKAAIARRITMDVDASMRIAARGRAACTRRTCFRQSGKTDQQTCTKITGAQPCHADIPEPLQFSFREKETLLAQITVFGRRV